MLATDQFEVDRVVFDTGTVRIGAFRCSPRHPSFHDSGPARNCCFVFPRTSVEIQHEHQPAFAANPNVVTFYNKGQTYLRNAISDDGDRCDWFGMRPDIAQDVVRAFDPTVDAHRHSPFRTTRGRSDASTYLAQRRLFDQVSRGAAEEPLAVEESVVRLLERVLRMTYRREPIIRLASIASRQDEVVRHAELILSERWNERLTLRDIARLRKQGAPDRNNLVATSSRNQLHSLAHMVRTTLLLMYMMMGAPALAGSLSQDSIAGRTAAASAAYEANDWTKAEPLYEQLVQAQPDSFRNWYRLGVCLQGMGKHQKALDSFQKAQAKGMPVSIVGYNISAVYASMGQTDRAIGQLTEAVKQGYAQADLMSTDPDLQSIRGDARFDSLVEQAKHNQEPCNYKPENRQFNFWVGDRDVVTTNEDSPAGISHIERAIGNCVIWENWTSHGNAGYAGKSYNIYNADLRRWEQFWVDDKGGMIHFYGGLTNGVMDFYTDETPQPDGTRFKRHLQFFNLGPDTVRQFSQGSTDGKNWTVEYDLTYHRKK